MICLVGFPFSLSERCRPHSVVFHCEIYFLWRLHITVVTCFNNPKLLGTCPFAPYCRCSSPQHPNTQVVRATFNAHSSKCFSPPQRFYEVTFFPHFAACSGKSFRLVKKFCNDLFSRRCAYLPTCTLSSATCPASYWHRGSHDNRSGAWETEYSCRNNYSLESSHRTFWANRCPFSFYFLFDMDLTPQKYIPTE